jgi:RNA polymerase sigma-70 factor, ECF subfamily
MAQCPAWRYTGPRMDAFQQQTTNASIGTEINAESTSGDSAWCVEIARRIGAGNAEAEASFAERLRPGLLMLLKRRCAHDLDLADDLCQETLVIVLQRLRNGTIGDPSRLAAFAAQTARQLAFDNRRRFAVRKTSVDSTAVENASIEAPESDSAEQASIASLVRKLLDELSNDRDREILRRFYLLEQDKEEICRTFTFASGTFDQLIFRARARMRALLHARGTATRDLLCAFTFWVPKQWLN